MLSLIFDARDCGIATDYEGLYPHEDPAVYKRNSLERT